MLQLDSSRWSQLSHCAGDGGDVSAILGRLRSAGSDSEFHEALDALMSVVWHQCDYCPAASAASPHLAELAGLIDGVSKRSHLVASVALIEIARLQYLDVGKRVGDNTGDDITPVDLAADYHHAVHSIPRLAAIDDPYRLAVADQRRFEGSMLVVAGDWRSGWDQISRADEG